MTPRQRAHIDSLHPELRTRMVRVLEACGGRLVPICSFRSPAEQAKAYDKGRDVMWGEDWAIVTERIVDASAIVTKAKPYSSAHNYLPSRGVDCVLDVAIVDVTKREGVRDAWCTTTPEARAAWALYGAAVQSEGLVWGGRWKMRDLPHAELVDFRSKSWGAR